MIKKTIYPKTKRVPMKRNVIITEKLDGSNLAFFKVNGILFVGTRNNVFSLTELELAKPKCYKGLYGWLKEHGEELQQSLVDGACIFGEWIGMGQIKYNDDGNEIRVGRFNMFAKANIDENFEPFNILYHQEFFIYPFESQEVPEFINFVEIVCEFDFVPSVKDLDELYDDYLEELNENYSRQQRVEGFIVILNPTTIEKYIRYKNGKMEEHKESYK